jgi:hypothetical protein
VAETDEPSRLPPLAAATHMGQAVGAARPWLEGAGLFAAALLLSFLGYLAATVPGRWFEGAPSRTWAASQLSLTRGSGAIDGDEIVVTGTDGSGTAVLSLETDFRSSEYRAIAWDAIEVPGRATLQVLWRTDYAPGKINSAPVYVASGRLLPAVLARDPNWVGRIRGIALLVQAPLPGPFRVRGVTAKTMSARDVAGDRVGEWFRFEAFTGTSVDGITGGGDVQALPLPALLALGAVLAAAAAFGIARARNRIAALPAMLAAVFIAAWLVGDVRWFANLVRQTRATAMRYAGLDWREKHLAAEDGALFAFIERVRGKLPPAPARVFVVGDTHYFRDRAAYHLYPHNVLFDPYANTMPDSARMRSGDFLVVYQRRGVQYDPGAERLRWDGGAPVSAELVLAETGAALFRLR